MSDINTSLSEVTKLMPDLVSAYTYANDSLYALLVRISTLYQNLANYYFANNGGGDGYYDYTELGDWYDVIIFSNHEGVVAQYAEGV